MITPIITLSGVIVGVVGTILVEVLALAIYVIRRIKDESKNN